MSAPCRKLPVIQHRSFQELMVSKAIGGKACSHSRQFALTPKDFKIRVSFAEHALSFGQRVLDHVRKITMWVDEFNVRNIPARDRGYRLEARNRKIPLFSHLFSLHLGICHSWPRAHEWGRSTRRSRSLR